MKYDFNRLEKAAVSAKKGGRYRDALRIYLFMADGDPSLDGGYLAGQIAECYERLGDLDAARYWYGRAVEENPTICTVEAKARKRLGDISIADLVRP
jgi:tetratricopeptide (TPR) repeat protein